MLPLSSLNLRMRERASLSHLCRDKWENWATVLHNTVSKMSRNTFRTALGLCRSAYWVFFSLAQFRRDSNPTRFRLRTGRPLLSSLIAIGQNGSRLAGGICDGFSWRGLRRVLTSDAREFVFSFFGLAPVNRWQCGFVKCDTEVGEESREDIFFLGKSAQLNGHKPVECESGQTSKFVVDRKREFLVVQPQQALSSGRKAIEEEAACCNGQRLTKRVQESGEKRQVV